MPSHWEELVLDNGRHFFVEFVAALLILNSSNLSTRTSNATQRCTWIDPRDDPDRQREPGGKFTLAG